MNRLGVLVVSVVLPCPSCVRAGEPAGGPARPVVIGYSFAGSGGTTGGEIPPAGLTHMNLAFAELQDGRIAAPRALQESLAALPELRRQRPRLRVLVSIGGWLGSGGFSDAAAAPERRRRLVESAVAFVRDRGLDGVDVDWEYPGLPGSGNRHRPEDRTAFSALLADLRRALDREGAARGRPLLLTIAGGGFPEYLAHVDLGAVQASVDLVNVMSYDFRVAEGGDEAGHHANLRVHPKDPRQLSVERVVSDFLAAGVPASKLVVGVPFYGRAWRSVDAATTLYSRGKPVRGLDVSSYPAIEALAASEGWRRVWDDVAQAPYLWNPGRKLFVSYEDERSLRLKARFVTEHGLAGVMFWEWHADPGGVLLQALLDGLRVAR